MSNICAGIGRGQMTILKEHIAHHKHIHDLYEKAFRDIDGITLLTNPDERFNSNYWLCNILIDPDKTGFNYEDLRLALEEANVESRPLWKPMHKQPVYKDAPAYVNGVSEELFKKGLCLPSGPCVSEDDVRYIVKCIVENII